MLAQKDRSYGKASWRQAPGRICRERHHLDYGTETALATKSMRHTSFLCQASLWLLRIFWRFRQTTLTERDQEKSEPKQLTISYCRSEIVRAEQPPGSPRTKPISIEADRRIRISNQ